ncbi:hypothetical protein [Tepidibacter formicigenes]|jgi:hypothetical protein|uniref:Uncharacterized protein n=1 Tax=Tepidibacter formicigenes DSM 15518 TaxID=1123349 RepID=A0A1M6SRX8_9FIRM|nr:hypothetical protein [Tepidibacter formicigenes]SHK47494.1 hypothetical protein SAMN02744037_02416 [Tepidibacter formicigenes DSM 15518]
MEKRFELIKQIAEMNDAIIEGKIKNKQPVGFIVGDTYINNPLLDETGKTSVENPEEYYGKDNIDKFIEDGKKIIE